MFNVKMCKLFVYNFLCILQSAYILSWQKTRINDLHNYHKKIFEFFR